MNIFNYRLTGPQSIERLEPLLKHINNSYTNTSVDSEDKRREEGKEDVDVDVDQIEWRLAQRPTDQLLHFVWETACEKAWTEAHKQAVILNRLSNTQIIEDKANLAFLQLRMKVPVLTTYLACSPVDVCNWAIHRWFSSSQTVALSISSSSSSSDIISHDSIERKVSSSTISQETVFQCETAGLSSSDAESIDDWWAVKAARGNGGKDVWIMNKKNFDEVCSQLPHNDEFVIQRYVERPLLWNGKKKFHFRCYSALHGDMSAMVYQSAYVLTASSDFDKVGTESMKHITNLSVNKATPNHPGQIPCHLPTEFPELFKKICDIWASVAEAATPFMSIQRSKHHFEFFGVDIIADSYGECWMIEANRLPGLESSNNNKAVEDLFYNTMMLNLLTIVTQPLFTSCHLAESGAASSTAEADQSRKIFGDWVCVKLPADNSLLESGPDAPTFKNLFSWRLFTKSQRKAIVFDLATAGPTAEAAV